MPRDPHDGTGTSRSVRGSDGRDVVGIRAAARGCGQGSRAHRVLTVGRRPMTQCRGTGARVARRRPSATDDPHEADP